MARGQEAEDRNKDQAVHGRTLPGRCSLVIVQAECLGRERGHVAADLANITLIVRMDSVAEKDDRGLRLRIDPDRGTRESGVTETLALGKPGTAIPRISRVAIPSSRSQATGYRHGLGQGTNGFGFEDADAIEFAAAEDHATKAS